MKRSILLVFSFYLLVSLASCSRPDTVFEGTLDFPSGEWLRFEPQQITAQIPNADDCYEIHLSAIIDTAVYHQPALPVTIKITSPAGEKRTLFADLLLQARDGHSLGQPVNGHTSTSLQFSQRIREYFYFNQPGDHTVSIGQRTSRYQIQGIRQVQFTIRKAKLEYPK